MVGHEACPSQGNSDDDDDGDDVNNDDDEIQVIQAPGTVGRKQLSLEEELSLSDMDDDSELTVTDDDQEFEDS